jgi:hypothetical protein
MLDVRSDVNIMPKMTWEALGKPQLTYSPFQLRMANQYFIFLIGRLKNVEIYVVGVKIVSNFEVIEIMGDKDPYPSLLSINWCYNPKLHQTCLPGIRPSHFPSFPSHY